ncbi:hypothetical protein BD309DRAFT_955150 [Dichomitus squalens]|uniref:F-box domain-containing protein n=1 Tax=Dichomitus squalens TaxID=114155 RepID=A0A4Q9N0G9_9APHY|nr:hypothetical protein BD311DRAFT_845603 [Dichomitus squalens]TBU45905.1 hypothetical protein BD309DRAFT_955150 [Dichomitus squalens]TBU56832.1 hypothetical protein BD310DRAFT_930612 [Dichomitus squalens]
MSGPSVFSNLPVELVRDIFEHAAHSDRATARSLALVSSAVRHWTNPILYYTVILSSTRSLRAFADAISSKPSDFVRTRVRNLGIFTLGPIPSIHRILSACAGAQNVACGFPLPAYKLSQGDSALQGLTHPREQHLLGVACRDGWDASLVNRTVTHLRIQLPSFDSSRPDRPFAFSDGAGPESGWDRLEALPALTHLAVVYRPTGAVPPAAIVPHLAGLLPSSLSPKGEGGLPALQLILVQVVGARKDASFAAEAVAALNAAAVSASRRALRIVAEHAPLSVVRQWEDAVKGGQSMWESAEAVVRSRLANASQGK